MGNRNPRAVDHVNIADKILQAPDLNPAAQVIGAPYAAPTEAGVAHMPATNHFSQLGNALSDFMPAATRIAAAAGAEYSKDEHAKAMDDQRKLAMPLNDAVRKGLIEPGASFPYRNMYNQMELRDRAAKASGDLYKAYSENADVLNSDNPQDFEAFAQKFRQDQRAADLTDPTSGHQKYSPLQVKESRYDEHVDSVISNLRNHNTQYRIDERTKAGLDKVAGFVSTTILAALNNPDGTLKLPHERNYSKLAEDIEAIGYSATHGAVTTGGLPGSLMRKQVISTVMDTAIQAKDASLIREIGAHLGVSENKPYVGTKEWIASAAVTRDHIAQLNFTDIQHREIEGKMQVEGTFEERMAHYGTTLERTQRTEAKAHYVDTVTNKILSYADPSTMTKKQLNQRDLDLYSLRQVDAKAADTLEGHLRTQSEHRTEVVNKKLYPLSEMTLYNAMLDAPGTPATNRLIDQALKDENIGGEEWRRLRVESDRVGQAFIRHKTVLSDPIYTNLEDGAYKGVFKDPSKPFGAESVAAARSKNDFRMQAIDFLDKNPGTSAVALATYMRPFLEDTVLRYNDTAKAAVENAKAEEDIQKVIIQNKLSETEVKSIRKNEGTHKNAHGVTFTQTREDTMQIIKATAQSKKIDAADKSASSGFPELNTILSPNNEDKFKVWKKKYAPRDSGADYDLRGAFKAGLTPDPTTGHWPDTFKKPNHPTFSDESKYAEFGTPGHWDGDTFVPGPRKKNP